MSVQARIHSRYRFRIAALALILLGWGGWSLLDGLHRYPAHNAHRTASLQAFEDYQEAHGNLQGWEAYARQHGFAQDPRKLEEKGLILQYIMAGLFLPAGVGVGGYYLLLGGRWIRTDGEGMHTSRGHHAPWAALQSVDKSRWQRKGIAIVYYNDGSARRHITLDDWKYDTRATEQILAEVEAQLEQGVTPAGAQDADAG